MTKRAMAVACAWIAVALSSLPGAAAFGQTADDVLSSTLIELEDRLGARVGMSIIDTQIGEHWSYRSDERFPLTSTFKAFACGSSSTASTPERKISNDAFPSRRPTL